MVSSTKAGLKSKGQYLMALARSELGTISDHTVGDPAVVAVGTGALLEVSARAPIVAPLAAVVAGGLAVALLLRRESRSEQK